MRVCNFFWLTKNYWVYQNFFGFTEKKIKPLEMYVAFFEKQFEIIFCICNMDFVKSWKISFLYVCLNCLSLKFNPFVFRYTDN